MDEYLDSVTVERFAEDVAAYKMMHEQQQQPMSRPPTRGL